MVIQEKINHIEALLNKLVKLIKHEQSIYNVIGKRFDELINSRLLAYYLNENENHEFGRSFFDALLTCMNQAPSNFQGNYIIKLEKDNIDILIAKPTDDNSFFDWAIILENKINHHLNNPLKEYWKKVSISKDGKKHGVVLSIQKQSEEKLKFNLKDKTELVVFENVLHKSLIEKFDNIFDKKKSEAYTLFKEYKKNVTSFYTNAENVEIKEDRLKIYLNNKEAIREVMTIKGLEGNNLKIQVLAQKFYAEIDSYIQKQVLNALNEHHFVSGRVKKYSKAMRLNPNSEIEPYFRIWVRLEALLKWNQLNINFELRNHYVSFGKLLDKNIKNDPNNFSEYLTARNDIKKGVHGIAKLNIDNFWTKKEGFTLKQQVYDAIKTHIFHKEGIYHKCVNIIKIEIKSGA